jgi:hypothetical protein
LVFFLNFEHVVVYGFSVFWMDLIARLQVR